VVSRFLEKRSYKIVISSGKHGIGGRKSRRCVKVQKVTSPGVLAQSNQGFP
jgi:hypothetical protein